MSKTLAACPCGAPFTYAQCCQRWHDGVAAPDAEALMRSRYSAFVLGLEAYLLATWHPDTRPAALDLHTDPPVRWLGLEVRQHAALTATTAQVEFVARSKLNGRAHRLHEICNFVREDGHWYYLAGEIK